MEVQGRLAGCLLDASACLGGAPVDLLDGLQRALEDLLDAQDLALDVGLDLERLLELHLCGVLLALRALPERVAAEEHALNECAQLFRSAAWLGRRGVIEPS